MDCDPVAELLPGLMNGTLDPAEAASVREHVTQCPTCRAEFGATREAWSIFAQHIPSSVLVEFAFDRPTASVTRALIERHLDTCADCRDELQLVQENRRAEAFAAPDSGAVMARGWTRRAWPWWYPVASAAALVLWTTTTLWVWNRWSGAPETDRLTALQSENDRLRGAERQARDQRAAAMEQASRLQTAMARLDAPQVNTPVFELYSASTVVRGVGDTKEIALPREARLVTLILYAQDAPAASPLDLEIVDERQQVVWRAGDLVRQKTSDFTVTIPASFLRPGSYTFNVYGAGKPERVRVATYSVRIK